MGNRRCCEPLLTWSTDAPDLQKQTQVACQHTTKVPIGIGYPIFPCSYPGQYREDVGIWVAGQEAKDHIKGSILFLQVREVPMVRHANHLPTSLVLISMITKQRYAKGVWVRFPDDHNGNFLDIPEHR